MNPLLIPLLLMVGAWIYTRLCLCEADARSQRYYQLMMDVLDVTDDMKVVRLVRSRCDEWEQQRK